MLLRTLLYIYLSAHVQNIFIGWFLEVDCWVRYILNLDGYYINSHFTTVYSVLFKSSPTPDVSKLLNFCYFNRLKTGNLFSFAFSWMLVRLSICVYYLVVFPLPRINCLSISFVQFSIGIFFWIYTRTLHIVDITPLNNICIADIFFQSIARLLTF